MRKITKSPLLSMVEDEWPKNLFGIPGIMDSITYQRILHGYLCQEATTGLSLDLPARQYKSVH